MRIAHPRARRSVREPVEPGLTAPCRVDRRTKNLTKRIKPGEIAVIDHLDLDRVSAEALVAKRVGAVVNASPSSSGRYPNLGPDIVLAAGIPLVDACGPDVMAIPDGSTVRLDEGALVVDGRVVAKGSVQTPQTVAATMEQARAGLAEQLEAFAGNTMDYLRRERELLLDGVGVPEVRTVLEGRHVLLVVRGYHYKDDLKALRPYIREYRPVLIGVDGGADALLESGYLPDMVVGDMDSVSDRALASGAELVVHAYRDGRAPGLERLEALGLPAVVFPATGTSEDVAMLLADDKGASLIVAVGTHATLVEFLDKGRSGMASTFLTRLRVGGKLVDAKGVSRLYRSRISTLQVALLVAAGLLALAVAMSATAAGQVFFIYLQDRWADLWFRLGGLFS
ncbi:putative membrane-anchored protein [Motilibacter peucedani]|uniref:Putative membrane-anchored protein n=1 Tax=Motilibacter peucedani TaxID=598650 RepID=A0A420XSR1_9ACTN|nr:putative cytokinetic ring protein SteA [Motilibacter peucedani]RKS77851.1 putative membrane-anchored protein [Motilibacter peucedani]